MKKKFLSIAVSAVVLGGTLSSCNNEAENNKLKEADEQAIATLVQAKTDELNKQLLTECETKIAEAAKLKFDSLSAAALASAKKPAKPASKPKPATKPAEPAKPTSGMQSQSDANKGGISTKSDQNYGGLRSKRDQKP